MDAAPPRVVLRQGTYVGQVLAAGVRFPKAIDSFRGVPYAKAGRFEEALPLEDSREVFNASWFGKTCPTTAQDLAFPSSEDCLNANIYRPSTSREDGSPPLPVVVYVHGGAFNVGKGAERNMAFFVAYSATPIIGINFNYRLGPLGFLPSGIMAKEGLLNLGLRDQRLLLEWVRANVAAFGGDPENVTLMGLSAGAHSVSLDF
jgi:carboxylesterase type B